MAERPGEQVRISFNSGEFDPKFDSRADIERSASACRELFNMIGSDYGSAKSRPGTQFIGLGRENPLPDEPETTAWKAAVTTAGGTWKFLDAQILNRFIVKAKASGYFSKIVYFMPLLGDQLDAALVPLLDTLAAGAPTNTGLTDANYTRAGGLDNLADVDAHLDTAIDASQASGLGGHVLEKGPVSATGNLLMGFGDVADQYKFELNVLDSLNQISFNWGNPSSAFPKDVVDRIAGTYYGQKIGAVREVYQNGVLIDSNSDVSNEDDATADVFALMGSNRGTNQARFNGRVGCFILTDGSLSSTEVDEMHDHFDQLFNDYRRRDPDLEGSFIASSMWRFQFSTTTTFALEVGGGYVRFFANKQQVLDGSDPYEVVLPYTIDEVREVQAEQVGDVIYIAHGNHWPGKLTRIADDDWEFDYIDTDSPAILDPNADKDIQISASATTGTVTLTATGGDVWTEDNVGGYFQISHEQQAQSSTVDITGNSTGSSIQIYGKYNLRTYGNWGATVYLERSVDGGTTWKESGKFEAYLSSEGLGSRNVDVEGEASEPALYRLRVADFDDASDAKVVLETYSAIVSGVVEITGYTSETSVTALVIEDLKGTAATPYWAEGAWSERRGYPRAVCLHEQRVVFGGTAYQPRTFWGSAIGDFETFEQGSLASDPYSYELAGPERNAIQWMESGPALLIGTSGAVYAVRGDLYGAPISPTAVDVKRQEMVGSEYRRAVQAGGSLLFIERRGRKLRLVGFSSDANRFVSEDITLYASHVTESGIAGMAWQSDLQILWAWMNDGTLASLSLNQAQGVVGWARHDVGFVMAAVTLYGTATETDQLWLMVGRDINSQGVITVEMMDPTLWTTRDEHYAVDGGLIYDGDPVGTVSGLSHIEGATVNALGDGIAYDGLTVDGSGQVTLPGGATASRIHVGFGFTAALSPMRLDADSSTGLHIGKTKRIEALSARVYRSSGWSYDIDGTTYDAELFGLPSSAGDPHPLMGDTKPVDVAIDWEQGHGTDPVVRIVQTRPLPLEVLSLTASYTVGSE